MLRRQRPVEVSSENYWSRCVPILIKLDGRKGEKAASEIPRTGAKGGLYAVLQAVAMKVAEECSRNEIAARVGLYWESLFPVE